MKWKTKTYGMCQKKFTYCSCSIYNCTMTTVHLKTTPVLCLVNRNYATHSSVITVPICYA